MATQTHPARPSPARQPPREEDRDFDRIRCSRCGRTYPALDGPALLYSLKSTCPSCGGGFELVR